MEVVDTLAAILAIIHHHPKTTVTTAGRFGNSRCGRHQVAQEGRILRGGQGELGDGLLGNCKEARAEWGEQVKGHMEG